MGSDSGSEGGQDSAKEEAEKAKREAEKKAEDAKEAKERKDYLDKLSKAKGWERFALGSKYGYKDWTSVKDDDTAETRDKINSIFGKDKGAVNGDAETRGERSKPTQNAPSAPGSKPAVQSLLNEDASAGLADTPSSSPLDDSVGPLGLNKTKDVTKVQGALVAEGDLDEQTGFIGTKTLDATKAFQDKKGLKVDGQINPGGPTERALLGAGSPGARSEVASPYSRAPADTPSIEQQSKTWAQSQQRQQQAKQAPKSGYFSKNGVTFTDNWANDLIGGKASATTTAKGGPLGRTQDQKAADVGEAALNTSSSNLSGSMSNLGPFADEFMGLTNAGGPKSLTQRKDIRQKVLDFRANMAGKLATGPTTETVGLNGTNERSDVLKVQSDLVEKGMLDSRYMSGYIGKATVDGIKALQEQMGRPATGNMTPEDVAEMMSAQGDTQTNDPMGMLDPNIVERGDVVPFGIDKRTGKAVLALPNAAVGLLDAFTLPGRVLNGEPYTEDQITNMALNITGGGLLSGAKTPLGVLGMSGGKRIKPSPPKLGKYDPSDTRWGRGGKHLFGAKGVKVESHTVYRNTTKYSGYRFDVENSAPGKRAGQIHLQTPDGQKYVHNVNTGDWALTTKTKRVLTNKERDMLETKEFKQGLDKALHFVGEQ